MRHIGQKFTLIPGAQLKLRRIMSQLLLDLLKLITFFLRHQILLADLLVRCLQLFLLGLQLLRLT